MTEETQEAKPNFYQEFLDKSLEDGRIPMSYEEDQSMLASAIASYAHNSEEHKQKLFDQLSKLDVPTLTRTLWTLMYTVPRTNC